jgi:nicotinamidase-related amidase
MKRMTGGLLIDETDNDRDNYLTKKFEKNILLIIDPQNDFSDVKIDKNGDVIERSDKPIQRAFSNNYDGNLKVDGASNDYSKIIKFINDNNPSLDEIHVSLDTHTDRHIGHPGFWSRVDENGNSLAVETNDTDGLRILKYVKDNVYEGKTVFPIELDEIGSFTGKELIRYYTPRNYEDVDYDALCEYVKRYIEYYKDGKLPHGQHPWIWRRHCIESTKGHKIAEELQECLDKYPGKVKYHIKGQNNLAEMYSIFSAEMPVNEKDMDNLRSAIYTGKFKNNDDNVNFLVTGVDSYEKTQEYVNLDTERNTDLMDYLLGNNNRIFVCGEAKTHCVKSSLIDLMEYAREKGIPPERIVLLSNMTSPIKGAEDNIVDKTHYVFGYSVFEPNNPISIPIIDPNVTTI